MPGEARSELARPSQRPILAAARGGLLAVCGPPLGGKSPLAARLRDCLPDSVKLEVPDDLSTTASHPGPDALALLETLPRDLRRGGYPRVTILCARLATPRLRVHAARVAARHGLRFLLVECRSSDVRALRRLSRLLLSPEGAAERVERYRAELQAYQAVSEAERLRLPAIKLGEVLGDLAGATERAIEAWSAR